MNTYEIRYVEGNSTSNEEAKKFIGLRDFKLIEAPSKVEALKKFHEIIDADEITGLAHRYGSPIGFSQNELKELRKAGISLKAGFPQSGIQVEEMVLKDGHTSQ